MTDITNSGCIPEKKTVCALGLFDGVHRGHQLIITTAVKKAQSLDGHSAVFCFKTDTVTSKGHDGMRFFGYEEMEIVDSPKQPNDLLGFLLSISEYVLSEGVELKDGETIGFSEEQKLPITLSDGVSVPGKTLKIKY